VKPKLFIASSVEGLEIAEAVNLNLEYCSENTLWSNAFQLSSITLTSLAERANSSDFGVFIFTPDDQVEMRGNHNNSVRDNVLFELGIFIGSLGVERCFIIKPRNVSLHIPTDLAGVTIADYEPNRSDNDLSSALSSACTKIKMAIQALGGSELIETPSEVEIEVRPIELSEEAEALIMSAISNENEVFDTVQIRYAEPKVRPYLNQALEDVLSIGYFKFARSNRMSKSMIYCLTSEGRKYALESGLVEHI
jgi:hypothetical protein